MKKIIFTIAAFAFLANVSAQFRVNFEGNTVLGGTPFHNPPYKLYVIGDAFVTGTSILGSGRISSSTSNFRIQTGETDRITILNSNGNVGIGIAIPQYRLDVTGSARVTGDIYLGSSSSNFLGTTANNIPITFKINNSLAGFTGSSTNSNVSFGYGTLKNLTGGGNVAVGYNAFVTNWTGCDNIAIGSEALHENALGSRNIAIGDGALCWQTTGDENIAIGSSVLRYNGTGNLNTAIGCYALACGDGSQNTAIGALADLAFGYLSNTTVIGHGAIATASDQVVLGNTTVTSILGYNSLTIVSDGRIKKSIRAAVPGLAFINQLQPVMYNLDLNVLDELQKSDDPKINARRDSIRNTRSTKEKEIEARARAKKEKIVYSGFIAQDVEKAAQSIGYDFSGVDAPENGQGAYGLRYAEFVVPLVKAVQELSEQNDAKDADIVSLQEIVKKQQDAIDELKQRIEKLEGNAPVVSLRSTTDENATVGLSDAVIEQCRLYQNAPNPFNQETQIKYYLPQAVTTAYLCIYNLQGTQIKQILITQRGEGSQRISGSELAAGMYLYALIVDGKEVDTKRMILTK